jgi:hypothetical protein
MEGRIEADAAAKNIPCIKRWQNGSYSIPSKAMGLQILSQNPVRQPISNLPK